LEKADQTVGCSGGGGGAAVGSSAQVSFLQQHLLVKARIASRAPMMVSTISTQQKCHQAKTITRSARMNLQKQNVISSSL